MRATVSFLTAVVMVFTATGCGVRKLLKVKRPSAQVTSVSVLSQSAEGVRVEVVVNMSNPNQTPLPLLRSQYRLTVDDVGSFEMTDALHRTLPAGGRQVVTLPAVFEAAGVSLTGTRYTIAGSITYVPPGQIRKLLTESSIPLPSVPFQAAGQLE